MFFLHNNSVVYLLRSSPLAPPHIIFQQPTIKSRYYLHWAGKEEAQEGGEICPRAPRIPESFMWIQFL